MPLFKKKPVVIEARRFDRYEDAKGLAAWCGGWERPYGEFGGVRITIHTLEGAMDASVGDWIIKGTRGEFYPCKADVFCDSYEGVE